MLKCIENNRSRCKYLSGTEKSCRRRESLGCWIDVWYDRAISGGIRFKSSGDALTECQDFATNRGWTVFAVGYKVECFTSATAGITYKRHGFSTGCQNGVGQWGDLQVYRIINVCPGKQVLPKLIIALSIRSSSKLP